MTRTYTGLADDDYNSTSSDGKAITDTRYGYDSLGRLVSVTVVERNDTPITPETTEYRYDLMGNLDKVRLPNEVVNDYTYDQRNRLTQLKTFDDDYASGTDWIFDEGNENLLAQFDYDLLLSGKRSGMTEIDDADATTTVDWFYDNLGRLTEEVYDAPGTSLDFTADYVLDLVGNRVQKTVDATVDQTIDYEYDANDRLLSETKDVDGGTADDRLTEYLYGDSNEKTQQTQKTVKLYTDGSGGTLEVTNYTYNLQGRMEMVAVDSDANSNPDTVSEYTYGDAGNRVRVVEKIDGNDDGDLLDPEDSTTTTDYVVDANNRTGYTQVFEEKDGTTGDVKKSYTLGHDVISQQAPAVQSGGTLFLLYDGHGTTRSLVDATGQVINSGDLQVFRYDAFVCAHEGQP